MTSAKGFSLLELLVAIGLLGVLTTTAFASYGSLIALTGKSSQTLLSTVMAQEVVEAVRSSWRAPERYALACVEDYTLPAGVEVQLVALDRHGQELFPLSLSSACGGFAPYLPPLMKRLSVHVTDKQVTLQVDIPRP